MYVIKNEVKNVLNEESNQTNKKLEKNTSHLYAIIHITSVNVSKFSQKKTWKFK